MGNFKSWVARSMSIAGMAGLTIGGIAILLSASGAPASAAPASAATAKTYTLHGVQVSGFTAVDAQGNIYADSGASFYSGSTSLVKFSATGKILAQWGGLHVAPDRPDQAAGIALDTHGNVYVVDSDANRVVKLSSNLKVLARWGGYGVAPGQFVQPQGIAVDAQGDMYVADTGNARIQKLAPNGSVLAIWRNTTTLRNPLAIKVDAKGSVFVLDNGYNGLDRVDKFSPTFHLLATWDLTLFGGATFGVDLAVDKAGHPYVADQGQADIMKLSSGGSVLTWLYPPSGFTVMGLALSPQGTLYASECPSAAAIDVQPTDDKVPDASRCRIAKFGSNGKTRAIWKSGAKPAPPGHKIDIGGYGLYLHCLGQGSPTVILDAGEPDDSRDWSYLQPQFAPQTRVCAYDRAGLGLSDARPASVKINGLVFTHEEHALLQKAGIPGPYVIAGFSWGGGFARLFAYTYPAEVAGMVLVDSVNENELDNNQYVSAIPDLAAARKQLHTYTPHGIAGTLGHIPVVVLSENPSLPSCGDCMEPAWPTYQAQLATASSNTVHVMALRSGHAIVSDQPAVVVEAVREAVDAVRAPSHALPACGTAFTSLGGACLP